MAEELDITVIVDVRTTNYSRKTTQRLIPTSRTPPKSDNSSSNTSSSSALEITDKTKKLRSNKMSTNNQNYNNKSYKT